ncbi:50S ribosomal protein L10 [bacterium]|nr:MAG: 50S ribosomal protein L10 [bacterium]
MPTAQKAKTIEQAKEWYSNAVGVVFTDYRGLKVKEMQALRADLRKQGAELHVIKNTLFRLAAGDDAQGLPTDLDNGTTAYAFVNENEAAVAKALLDYARTSKKLVVKGGLFGGKAVSAKQVEAISTLPSKDVLISQVIGVIAAPLSQLVGTVEAIYAQPIRTIYAIDGGEVEADTSSDDPQVHGYTSDEAPPTPVQTDVEGGHVVTPSEDPSELGAITTDPSATVPTAENAPTISAREDVGGLPEAGDTDTGKGAPGAESA